MQANENSNHQTKDPVLLFFNRVIAQVSRVLAAYVYATAAVTFALAVGCYLIVIRAQGAKRRMSRSIVPSGNC